MPAMAKSRIVALSGYGQDEQVRRSSQAGFDGHLTKPVDHETIITELRRART
jgi:CheY-like chemotaxis protein